MEEYKNNMIIRAEKLQPACSKLLPAVDSSAIAEITDVLELKASGKILYINVTNREYFAQVKIELDDVVDFHATVSANLFLRLVSQITTETVELNVAETTLKMKANGSYDIPLIFDNDKLMELPAIEINNVTTELTVESDILQSILNYNSKELMKDLILQPVQKMYYVDQEGCITFTTGACVNNFQLEQPIKVLLNQRLVKLFKLFNSGKVKVTLGHDAISDTIIQTKIKFENDIVCLTAILSCDDDLVNKVPAAAIRGRANKNYPYNVSFSKSELNETINRLLLFSSTSALNRIKSDSKFVFEYNYVSIYDVTSANVERVFYKTGVLPEGEQYIATFDLNDLKHALDSSEDDFVTFGFGDHAALVISSKSVRHVVPEVSV
jgi:DNA polymerase III sliding clamp (beta) subunit (PCNA family)